MFRRPTLSVLLLLLALAVAFTAWRFLSPYDADADPAADYEVEFVEVTRDEKFRWLDVHLQRRPGGDTVPPANIHLLIDEDERVPPAAIGSLFRGETAPSSEPSLRFWLEAEQLGQRLTLVLGPDRLRLKTTTPAPNLQNGQTRAFRSTRW